jgi:hypothetical protein
MMRRLMAGDISTHHMGSRETDMAVWLHGRLLLRSQDGRVLLAPVSTPLPPGKRT